MKGKPKGQIKIETVHEMRERAALRQGRSAEFEPSLDGYRSSERGVFQPASEGYRTRQCVACRAVVGPLMVASCLRCDDGRALWSDATVKILASFQGREAHEAWMAKRAAHAF